MSYTVTLSPRASQELSSHVDWLVATGQDSAAERFVAHLEATLDRLASMPTRYPPSALGIRLAGRRAAPVLWCYLVYSIDERAGTVAVLAVLHERSRPTRIP